MPRTAAALRDSSSPDLRDHLIGVAERLIAQRRTDKLTVRAIAREAQVADGVLYNYFTDKEELLAHALLAHIEAAERDLPAPPRPGEGTLEASLAGYLRHILDLHERILPAFAGLLSQPKVLARFNGWPRSKKGDDLRQTLTAYLDAEQRHGRIRAGTDTGAAAALLVGACYEVVLPRLLQPAADEPLDVAAEFLDSIVATILGGIRA
ncbi:TetR/AcrR family transcriptional regulator [Saccharopolyspora indica]|uniref:TetR/AcrR family transcriptional regulator n=1 Tax=Saccharopolyspora indica TaxID=1229659 RepID=UPI0022EA46BC|nr:TetR/AcrR family transcriptional regulator [Saccharopolyspora indica]MDA3643151.1 helix-turn-helix domain containing protein [Saccharopolyspora indica]